MIRLYLLTSIETDYDNKVVFPTPESPSNRMATAGWLSMTIK